MRPLNANHLRWAVIWAILIACCAAIVATPIWHRFVSPQKNAVATLVNAGGICLYDFEYDFDAHEGRIRNYVRPSPPSPILLVVFGKDCLATPVYVQFTGRRIGDREVAHLCDSLAQLPTVCHLNLRETRTSDRSIACLGRLRQLTVLDVRDTAITTNGIGRLKGLLPNSQILSGASEGRRNSQNRTGQQPLSRRNVQ